jgi:hypothetical protein
MRKFAVAIGVAAGLLLFAGSQASAQVIAKVYVGAPPPVEIVEHPPAAPGPAYVWIKGFHVWREGHYVWTRGHWEIPPRDMHIWIPGHWDHEPGGYFWVEGHWARR